VPDAIFRRLIGALLDRTGRIRSRRFWHAVHWVIDREAVVRVLVLTLRLASRGDEERRIAILTRFRQLCVRSGWPGHPPTWMNLDFARLEWRLRRGRPARGNPRRPPARALDRRLRVGLLGQFSKLTLCSSPRFVSEAAARFDVVVFDVEHPVEGFAGYLADHVQAYVPVSLDGWIDAAAAAANAAHLDLLHLFEMHSVSGGELLDRVDAPCVVHYCTGSEPLHDPRVSFQLQDQPQPDYFVRDDRIFCTMCRRPLSDQVVYDENGCFEVADRPERVPSWSEREPLVLFHGSLFKAAAPDFLAVVYGLLRDDPALRFVLFGKNDPFGRVEGTWLDDILETAERYGVRDRVEYRGEFSVRRSSDGVTRTDAGWRDLRDHLLRTRLAPDPWPLGGGNTRAEAYAFGVPGVHMRVRLDPASWGRPQPATAEILSLLVPDASADTVEEYAEICRRVLTDGELADRVARRQLELLEPLLDLGAYWDSIRRQYETWLETQPATTASQAT
jgi:hypothetical protein